MSYTVSTQCFEMAIGDNGKLGLKPITTDDLEIGQKVIQAREGDEAIITAKTMHGYTVTFEDGSQSHGQTVGALSPFTRIAPVEPAEIVGAEEVERLNALAIEYREEGRRQQEEAARQKATDKARIITELRKQYPWAVAGDNLSGHARASKNLKKELSLAFPGVKFSVRSDSFSGGDSIDVHWDFGPTTKQVGEIANKYKNSDFDGMTDSTNYDHSAYGEAVEVVLGRTRFVSCVRNSAPREFMEKIERGLCAIQHREYAGPETNIMDSGLHYNDQVNYVARDLFFKTSCPQVRYMGLLDFTIESNNDRENYVDTHWAKIVFAAQPEPIAAPALSAGGVTVTENEEKNGVEIRFDSKPSEEIRDALKSNGFRWSRFQSLWYARRSAATLAFAQSLI